MTQEIKELLELAAKACGATSTYVDKSGNFWVTTEGTKWGDWKDGRIWRPDLDDGDGARMEEKLKTEFFWDAEEAGEVGVFAVDVSDIQIFEPYATHNGNRQAARRMASLRVAAIIGGRM